MELTLGKLRRHYIDSGDSSGSVDITLVRIPAANLGPLITNPTPIPEEAPGRTGQDAHNISLRN